MQCKIAWLSRHEMSEEQYQDLIKSLAGQYPEGTAFRVETINHTWSASADADADISRNRAQWQKLSLEFEEIAGVFPPVSLGR